MRLSALLMAAITTIALNGAVVATQEAGGVRLYLRLDKVEYRVGEALTIELTATNIGGQVVRFEFPTGQMFDFVIMHEGQRIWQWSSGRVFTQVVSALTLNPGDVRAFRERWNQVDATGRQVSPGRYEVVALFPYRGRGVGVPLQPDLTLEFLIVPPPR